MIKYKTGKANAYVIRRQKLQKATDADFITNMTLFSNNPVTETEITVLTHGFKTGYILYGDFKKLHAIYYNNLPIKLSKYFPFLRKINLICCYNKFMPNCKVDNISICIPEIVSSNNLIYFAGWETDTFDTINLFLKI